MNVAELSVFCHIFFWSYNTVFQNEVCGFLSRGMSLMFDENFVC